MRKLHPAIVLFLAVLFAVQTVAALSSQCAELHRNAVQPCCACCQQVQADQSSSECDCYQAPQDPPATPVVQTPTTLLAAALPSSPEPVMPSGAERLHALQSAPAPHPSFVRDTDVRGPPCPR